VDILRGSASRYGVGSFLQSPDVIDRSAAQLTISIMHVLLITDKEVTTPLSQQLLAEVGGVLEQKGNNVEIIEVGSEDVAPCLGCLSYYTRTHGGCAHKDAISRVNERIGNFDLVCFFGPIVFGQFASTMTNVLDRVQTYRMIRSRFVAAIGYGESVFDHEAATFLDIFRKHRGEANIVHPQIKERFEVFVSRSVEDTQAVGAWLRRLL